MQQQKDHKYVIEKIIHEVPKLELKTHVGCKTT
jgi:hypothetical protein